MRARQSRNLVQRGLMVGNVLMPLVAGGLWYDVASNGSGPPAMDRSGAGLVLLTVVRGY
ncbi:MAG TPA: hypothetical protein VMP03_01415 [Methylomirabilota bacterium]|nr:hypothetical protein [Methylomirabilota bacterium]